MSASTDETANGEPDAARGFDRALPVALGTCLVAGAAALVYGSMRPLSFYQSAVADLGLGMFSSYLTTDAYAAFIERLRLAALVLAAGAASVFVLRVRLSRAWRRGSSALIASARVLRQDVVRALRGEPRASLWALLSITALGTTARAAWLSQPMREDEAFSFLFFASKPLLFGISVARNNNNHFLHTLLVHLSYLCFGSGPRSIRLPAFAAGVLMIPAAYGAARILHGTAVALFTSALVASSSVLIEFSANARGYTLLCLCVLVAVGTAGYASRRNNGAAWAVFVAAAAAGFYTMPLMFYPFGGILIWLVWIRPDQWRTCLLASAVVSGIVLVLYLPILGVSGPSAIVSNPYVIGLRWGDFLAKLPRQLGDAWAVWNRTLPGPVSWLVLAGFAAGQLSLAVRLRPGLQLPIAVVAFSLAATLWQRIALGDRIWLFALPIYLQAAVAGLAVVIAAATRARRLPLPPAWGLAAASVALCGWLAAGVVRSPAILQSRETGVLPAADEITGVLQQELAPHDAVYTDAISKIVLQYYFLRRPLSDAFLYPDGAEPGRRFVLLNEVYGDTPASVLREYGQTLGDGSRLRLVRRFASAGLYTIEDAR